MRYGLAVLLALSLGFSFSVEAQQAPPINLLIDRLIFEMPHRIRLDSAGKLLKDRVVVAEFQAWDAEAKNPLGTQLSDAVMAQLINRFQVLERSRLNDLIKEQGFSQSALAQADQAIVLGRLMGAEYILLGRYALIQQQALVLNMRLVDVESGTVLSAVESELPLSSAQRALISTHPANAPDLGPRRLFFEDFSGYVPGSVLPLLGPGMVVRPSSRYHMNVLTTEDWQVSNWSMSLQALQADNYAFEIHAIDTAGGHGLSSAPLRLIFQDIERRMPPFTLEKMQHYFRLEQNPYRLAPWQAQDWNKIRFEKRGDQLRLLINGQVVDEMQAAIPPFFYLRVESPAMKQWAFTRIGIDAL